MTGSVFLTILIAFCAVQGVGATTVSSPTTPASNDTSSLTTPASNATSSPATPASNATSSPTTPASNATSSPTTPASNATSSLTTPASNATSSPATPASNATSSPTTPASNATSSPATPASNATSSPTTPASNDTSSPTTPASNDTSSPTTPASNDTSSPTTPASNATAPEPLPCAKQPCNYGATCINLGQERVCQCPYGFFYGFSSCRPGKIFPGQLSVQYKEEMQNTSSHAYQELYNNVTQFFNKTFDGYDYKQTILVSISVQQPSTRLRAAENIAVVKFVNMFDESTNLTQEKVTEIIKNSPDKFFMSFTSLEQCGVYGCDTGTTNCTNPEDALQFPRCICKPGLFKKNPEDKACLLCANECTSENHKQCVHGEKGIPSCACQPDYEFKDEFKNGTCEECSFGYSGKDCGNNFLAVLIGVATACGAVIVVLTGVLIYKILRAKKESSSETRSLLNSDHSSTGRVSEYNSATNFAANEKMFPRVQCRNPTGVNKTVADNGGGQARYTQEPGIANKAYVPERDYDDDNPSFEMSERGRF